MCYFFFNDTATTEIYTLSLHDALPIYRELSAWVGYANVKPAYHWQGQLYTDQHLNLSFDFLWIEEVQSTSFRWDNPLGEDSDCFYIHNDIDEDFRSDLWIVAAIYKCRQSVK